MLKQLVSLRFYRNLMALTTFQLKQPRIKSSLGYSHQKGDHDHA